MPRGSEESINPGGGGSDFGGGGTSGGGGGTSGTSANNTEMIQTSGQIDNTGRYVMKKSFLVTDAATLPSVPKTPSNFKATGITWQSIGPNLWEKQVEYESFVKSGGADSGAGGGVVENKDGVEGRFELDTQDELYPIAAHPNLDKLMEKYAGKVVNGKVVFEKKYKPTGGGGLDSGAGGGEKSNPMFGKLYYTKPSAVFRHTQQTDTVPSDLWDQVGKKVEKLPAGFPSPPTTTNDKGEKIQYYWIVQSPQIYRRGNVYEIVRTYKLSDPNPPDELYKITTPSIDGGTGGGTGGGTDGGILV